MGKLRSYIDWLAYGLLSLIVLGPLLLPGYILNFDMVFAPNIAVPAASSNTFLFYWVLNLLGSLIHAQVIQKLLLIAILVLAGVGAHRLALVPDKVHWWGAAFAGTLYVVNPFTYAHFMTGQYLVLAGYALLPWFCRALWQWIIDPGWRSSLRVVAWALAISVVSIHMIGFVVVISLVVTMTAAASRCWRQCWRRWLGYGVVASLVCLVASSYWLVPLATGQSAEAKMIASFSSVDTQAFRTDVGSLGLPWNVYALSGFWGDRQDRYVLIWEQFKAWPVVMAVAGSFVLAGAAFCYRRRDYLGMGLAVTGLIAAALALGDAWGPAAPLNLWLTTYVPLFEGYREPQKFVALLVLVYAYLGARFVSWLQARQWVPRFAVIPLVLLPLLTAPTMLWAAGGQLKTTDYPADWYAANRYLNQYHAPKSLFLPWHQYMKYQFTHGRIIASPASEFFDTPVVSGDNPELAKNEPKSRQTQFVINDLHIAGQEGQDVSSLLRSRGYRYVLLSQSADYNRYLWLDRQPGIKLVMSGPTLLVYEVIGGQ